MSDKPDIYTFNAGFQDKILALLVRDPVFMASYRDVIKPFYFESSISVDVSRIILKYYDGYNGVPTFDTTVNLIDEYLSTKNHGKKDPEEVRKLYYRVADNIYSMDFTDMEYVRDKAIRFAKHQALKEAILKSVDLLGEDKYDEIEETILQARMVGDNALDLGLMYFENVQQRIVDTVEDLVGVVGTGSKDTDEAIGGGLGQGELGFILAPPNTGKTLRLINLGAGALYQRKTVVHYSMEMSVNRVAARYDSCFTGIPFDELRKSPAKLDERLARIRKISGGNLIIKAYPTGTATVNDIKSHLTRLQNYKGIRPDVVIVDYSDIMKPLKDYKDHRHAVASINQGLRGLAGEMMLNMWTASQTNRAALDKKIITIADLAEDFSKAAIADIIIALCQTQEEYDEGLLREFIAKSRNSKKYQVLPKQVDYERMRIADDGRADDTEIVDEEPVEEEDEDNVRR